MHLYPAGKSQQLLTDFVFPLVRPDGYVKKGSNLRLTVDPIILMVDVALFGRAHNCCDFFKDVVKVAATRRFDHNLVLNDYMLMMSSDLRRGRNAGYPAPPAQIRTGGNGGR